MMLKEFKKFMGWQVLEYFLEGNKKTGIRELSRKLNISTRTAKHYCDVLEESGFLSSEKAGTAKLFSLKINVHTRQWRIAYLIQLAIEHGLEKEINNPFYIFGSAARGEWGIESDLDIFVIKINDFDEEKARSIAARMGFVPSIASVEYFELDEYKKLHGPIIEEVKKGIYLGDEAHGL